MNDFSRETNPVKCEYCGNEIYYGAHACQEEINALRSDLRAALSELKTARAELEAARSEIADLKAENAKPPWETDGRCSYLIEQLEWQRDQARKELEAATGEIESLKSHHKITEGIIADARGLSPENGKALLHNLEQAKDEILRLKRQFNALVNETTETRQKLKQDLATAQTELSTLRSQIDGAGVLTVDWSSGYPDYEGLPDADIGQTRTFKLLEVKP